MLLDFTHISTAVRISEGTIVQGYTAGNDSSIIIFSEPVHMCSVQTVQTSQYSMHLASHVSKQIASFN